MDDVCIGPYMSECTISSGVRALFQLEMSLCAACQKCSLHKPSLVCRSMVILSPYSLCVVASATKIHMSKSKMPQPGFILNFCLKCSLQISAAIFFLVEGLIYLFNFYLECSSCICLPFYVGNYPQWKQAIDCH